MQFSMIFEAQIAYPTREAERQVFREIVEQSLLAEQVGFDRIWAVEHHALVRYAHMSAPEVFLAYVAARTERIRVGHGVVCLPFRYNHPIRVAERIATLDILSGGRVDFGAGRGATEQELGAFGVSREETLPQLLESLRMIVGMWQRDLFSWDGALTVPPRSIIPRPVQEPHPPLYLACTRDETLDLAGRHGLGALTLGFAGPQDMAEKRRRYERAIASRTDADLIGVYPVHHLSALCPAIVLDDRQEARRIGYRGQRFFAEAITHWYAGGPEPNPEGYEEPDEEVLRMRREALVEWLRRHRVEVGPAQVGIFNPHHAYGTVEDALEYVGALADAGVDEVMFLMQMGTVPHGAILETIRNLGHHVIPRFRKTGVRARP